MGRAGAGGGQRWRVVGEGSEFSGGSGGVIILLARDVNFLTISGGGLPRQTISIQLRKCT